MSVTEMFANRVRKNARHLGKWAKREGVTCWRVYDRDIPEVPVTRRHLRGRARHQRLPRSIRPTDAWLDELADGREGRARRDASVRQAARTLHAIAKAISTSGQARARRVAHRPRRRPRVPRQPQRLHRHRPVPRSPDHARARRGRARDARCSTCSLHRRVQRVRRRRRHAARRASICRRRTSTGRARTSRSTGSTGEIIHADVREFLADARRAGRRWDLAVVDPPTFSNSKRMDYTWDVQRDHAALLARCRRGRHDVVWFSTNREALQARVDHAGLTDETHATTPPDFRHKPHRAWRIAV